MSVNRPEILRRLARLLKAKFKRYYLTVSSQLSVVVPIGVLDDWQTYSYSIAGNASLSLYPEDGRELNLFYGLLTLVCDATAANRNITIDLYDSGDALIGTVCVTPNITASQTKKLAFGFNSLNEGSLTYSSDYYLGRNKEITVKDADYIKVSVANGVAGDTLTIKMRGKYR